jgi:hypothetical protein
MERILNHLFPKKDIKIFSFYFCYIENDILTLLPSCHSIYYPLSFNVKTKQLVNGELNFFNSKIYNNLSKNNKLTESQTSFIGFNSLTNKKEALIINLLDDCFGHSIMKLLNVINAYNAYKDRYDLICITPKSLSYLIPRDKFLIIEVNIGFYELSNIYDLSFIQSVLREKYKELYYYILNPYEQHNLETVRKFFNFFNPEVIENKVKQNKLKSKKFVTFYYRSDFFRSWHLQKQGKHITHLFYELKEYFIEDVNFVILGNKDSYSFPDYCLDFRTKKFDTETDQWYNFIFNNSLIVIGYFGSALYLPSILCDSVFHIVPPDKYKLVTQDSINIENENSHSSYFRNCQIICDNYGKNLSAEKLAGIIISLYKANLIAKFRTTHEVELLINNPIGMISYLKQKHPYFNFDKAVINDNKLKSKNDKEVFFYLKLNKLLKLLRLKK